MSPTCVSRERWERHVEPSPSSPSSPSSSSPSSWPSLSSSSGAGRTQTGSDDLTELEVTTRGTIVIVAIAVVIPRHRRPHRCHRHRHHHHRQSRSESISHGRWTGSDDRTELERAVEYAIDEVDRYRRPSARPLVPVTYGIEIDEFGRRRPNVPEQVHVSYFGPNQMMVSFTTSDYGVPSAVEWGTESGKYTWQAIGFSLQYRFINYKSGLIHHVVLGVEYPLQPHQKYYYRCAKMGKELSFTMPPPLGANQPIKFGLLGDLGQTAWSASTLGHMKKTPLDMVLFAGDLSYADAYQPRWDTWGRLIEPSASSIPWMVVEGNHDQERLFGFEPEFKAYNARWQMPYKESGSDSNLYYSFEVAGAHIIMLNSFTDFKENSTLYSWLKGDLGRVDRQRTPWLIVLFHSPWYNSNYAHKNDGEEMRKAIEDLLYSAKVDLVFTGHVHAYERTKPMYNWKESPCGITYIVVGDGGNREGLVRRWKVKSIVDSFGGGS
ncbi:hypothetical protein CBR_g12379 [Chara braunii]|uniref:Purple acid phosphatase n=1 Tax=Chara braunii TaxID=69332 RepID=A0A388KS19_CHABU|nr:hypothetical protein CBR_g12379 [Chara braunii]|eukprot:GBG72812.1 hypothetical protein CBR_g12379 [Chara braunii]